MGGELLPGALVAGRYRIRNTLGHGGSGETYAADHIASGGIVALKRFKLRGAASWKSLELFEREARVLATLQHPCIPSYVESFSVDGPEGQEFYLAQTLAPGRSLAQWVADGARTNELDAKRMAEELLVVLRYLHALAPPVIHRDLKPANVIRGQDGRLALVDFGAVKDAPTDSHVGGTTVVGTYGFMAPEQFRGVASRTSDLYGLGATLVFLLTHQSPDQLPQKKLRAEIPKSLGLSKFFVEWLGKLLEPAPEDRFQTADAALEALRAGRLPRPKSSGWRVAVLLGVLGTCLLGAGGAWLVEKKHRAITSAAASASSLSPKPLTALLPEPNRERTFGLKRDKIVPAHLRTAYSLDISPDGKHVISGGADRTAKIWSTDTWELEHDLAGHTDKVHSVAFLPDGKTAVSAGDTTVRLWNAATGAAAGSVDVGVRVIALAVAPGGDQVVVGAEDGKVRAFSLPSLKPNWTTDHTHGKGRVLFVAFSPNGKLVATGADDGKIALWAPADGSDHGERLGHVGPINTIAFAPDSNQFLSTGDDGQCFIWDVVRPAAVHTTRESGTELWGGAFNPNGRWFITEDKAGLMTIRSFVNQDLLLRWQTEDIGGTSIRISSDGRKLLIAQGNGTFTVYSLPQPSDLSRIPKPPENLPDLPTQADAASLARQAQKLLWAYDGSDGSVLREAKALTEKALLANPKDALAMVEAAKLEEYRGYRVGHDYDPSSLDAAGHMLDAAIELNPRLYEAHLERAHWLVARAESGRKESDPLPVLDEARKEVDMATAADPARIGSEKLRSDIAEAEGKFDEMLRHATFVVEHARSQLDVTTGYQGLYDAYWRLGDQDAAVAVYQRRLELHPRDAWLRGSYANILREQGKINDAIESAEQALKLMNYPMGHHILASAWVDNGIGRLWNWSDSAGAREAFTKALKESPRSADATYGLIAVDAFDAAARGEKCSDCSKRLEEVLKLDKNHVAAKAALAQLAAQ